MAFKLMILQTFTVVLLRLLAIQAALGVIVPVGSFVMSLRGLQMEWYWLIAAGINLGAAILMWALAPVIGRIVCAKLPPSVAPLNASLVDLYSFAFLLVGLSLVATSVGSVLGWVYFMFSHAVANQGVNYRESFNSASQLVIGVLMIFKARAFALGLAGKHLDTANQAL